MVGEARHAERELPDGSARSQPSCSETISSELSQFSCQNYPTRNTANICDITSLLLTPQLGQNCSKLSQGQLYQVVLGETFQFTNLPHPIAVTTVPPVCIIGGCDSQPVRKDLLTQVRSTHPPYHLILWSPEYKTPTRQYLKIGQDNRVHTFQSGFLANYQGAELFCHMTSQKCESGKEQAMSWKQDACALTAVEFISQVS